MFIKCLNRQPLLDALPACGSENCIVLLSDLMRNKELEEEQAHAFLTTIALIPHPSPQIIDSINVGTSAGHSRWPKSLIKATFCINSYNMSVKFISAEISRRNTHIPISSHRPRGSAHPVSLLSALGLTGGPRGAVQGAAIWIIFGLSVVPKVTNLLQWPSSGTNLHTKAWGNPEGRRHRRKTHPGTYSRCSSCWFDVKIMDILKQLHEQWLICIYFVPQQLFYALKSVGNVGLSAPVFIPLLNRFMLGHSTLLELRLAAIHAFRRFPCSADVSWFWKLMLKSIIFLSQKLIFYTTW